MKVIAISTLVMLSLFINQNWAMENFTISELHIFGRIAPQGTLEAIDYKKMDYIAWKLWTNNDIYFPYDTIHLSYNKNGALLRVRQEDLIPFNCDERLPANFQSKLGFITLLSDHLKRFQEVEKNMTARNKSEVSRR
jgi:hypothetical protein